MKQMGLTQGPSLPTSLTTRSRSLDASCEASDNLGASPLAPVPPPEGSGCDQNQSMIMIMNLESTGSPSPVTEEVPCDYSCTRRPNPNYCRENGWVDLGPTCTAYALHYIDFHRPNRTQPGHCTRSTHHHRTGDSLMVSRLVVIVHVRKVQNAPRPIRFSRVNPHLGAPSCHQHGECVPPRRRELRRRPVVQVHITILVVRLGNAAFEKPLRSRSPNSSRFQTEGHELNTMRGLLLPATQCLMPRRLLLAFTELGAPTRPLTTGMAAAEVTQM